MVEIDNFDIEIAAQLKFFTERLREEREKKGISQIDLSFKSGLSQNQVNYIETGKRTPNLHTILSICKALEINPAVLFESRGSERQNAREAIMRLVSQFL